MSTSTPRPPLHERSDSRSNSSSNNSSQHSIQTKNIGTTGHAGSIASSSVTRAPIRLVPSTPPQLLGTRTSSAGTTATAGEVKDTTSRVVSTSSSNWSVTGHQDRTLTANATATATETAKSAKDVVYSRTPLPTHPSHILLAPGNRRGPAAALATPPAEFQSKLQAQNEPLVSGSSALPVHSTHTAPQLPQTVDAVTGSPLSKPKPPARKLLNIHKDNKTFSLLHDDKDTQSPPGSAPLSPILGLSRASSYDSLASEAPHAPSRSNSRDSCLQSAPATPSPQGKPPISADPITTASPWNYHLVGGIRKVPKTPDLKQKAASESPLPPVPEASDRPSGASHDLSTKLSFQSTQTASSSTSVSDNSNYKIYNNTFASTSDVALASHVPPSTSDSNYQLIGPPSSPPPGPSSNYQLIGPPSESSSEPASNVELIGPPSETSSNYRVIGPSSNASTTSSVIHRPYTAISETISENENYELHGDPTPAGSSTNLVPQPKYSHESLVVPPLKPKKTRSNENFGYYKSRSRESLRTGSLTSISTVLSQQEASRAIAGSGSIVVLSNFGRSEGSSSWAESSGTLPPPSHMNEHPHQWSSQLSTVLSVSEEGTQGRLSRDWASDSGRRSAASGFPSTPSRSNSRGGVLSISSSLALDESRSGSLDPPEPAFARNGRRHQSSGSIQFIENQDEYGDGITDMQDLRSRPSRTRLSGFFSLTSSENARTNTMRSTSSSRANSLVASSSIPTWARLYYGSGERRYLGGGAPGSSTESTMGSRASSFRSGSPNTDHFPLSIYSPRRRPREGRLAETRPSTRGSLEINQAPMDQDENGRFPSRFRTWSMSSVWSPHLRMDRRAPRHSVWDPPSVNWSADGSSFGRRNIQIIMFVIGFIFPFAWMIAAFLPLPQNPISEMRERDEEHSTSQLDSSNERNPDYNRRFGPIDEKRFQNARWWRNLNRWMSVVGVLIIAAIVILVVVSLKEGWAKAS